MGFMLKDVHTELTTSQLKVSSSDSMQPSNNKVTNFGEFGGHIMKRA